MPHYTNSSPSTVKIRIKKPSKYRQKITLVFTDGSVLNNSKSALATGGVGIFFKKYDKRNLSEPFTFSPITNNRAELYAIIRAITIFLQSIDYKKDKYKGIKHKLIIYSDSEYSINSVSKWIYKWKQAGWKTSNWKIGRAHV